MSKIEVNELAVRSGSNITVSSPIQGEGTAGTTLNQGLAKFFLKYDGSGTTLADSLNMSSATDNGTGDYTFTIANDMASIDFSISGIGANTTGSGTNLPMMGLKRGTAPTVTAFNVGTKFNQDGSFNDTDQVFATGHGDLA